MTPVRIAVTGDSIAYGRSDPTGGWAARLATHHLSAGIHGRRLWNLAIPGATLLGMKDYSPAECAIREVDTVLLSAGINDLAGVGGAVASPQQVVDGALQLCSIHEAAGRQVIVLGPTWVNQNPDQPMGLPVIADDALAYRDLLSEAMGSTGRRYIDLWEVLLDRPDLLADEVHPTTQGHLALWQAIHEHWEG